MSFLYKDCKVCFISSQIRPGSRYNFNGMLRIRILMNYPAASCEVSKPSFRLVLNLSSRRIPDALRLRE